MNYKYLSQVIIKEVDGVRCEPVERVQIDVPEEYTGSIMESMGVRKGEMLDMVNNGNGQVRLTFMVPAHWFNWLHNRILNINSWLRYFKPYIRLLPTSTRWTSWWTSPRCSSFT